MPYFPRLSFDNIIEWLGLVETVFNELELIDNYIRTGITFNSLDIEGFDL